MTIIMARLARAAGTIAALVFGSLLVFSFFGNWLSAADTAAHFRIYLTAVTVLSAAALLVGRAWRRSAAAGLVAVIGIAGLVPALPGWEGRVAESDAQMLTLVQVNLMFRNPTPGAVVALMRARQADVVTLQEVSAANQTIIRALARDYPYRVQCPFSGVGGVAVLSRLPLASGNARGCVKWNGLAWLRVLAAGRPLSVAAIHLHWPYPFGQAHHIDRLEKSLRTIPRPVLLGGDFNATPWSHAVRRIAQATGTRVAGGLRFTWRRKVARLLPAIRLPLDHVLVPPELSVRTISTGPEVGSDHRPVITTLAFR